jgi:hypothetical protein
MQLADLGVCASWRQDLGIIELEGPRPVHSRPPTTTYAFQSSEPLAQPGHTGHNIPENLAAGTGNTSGCGNVPERGILDKSHNRLADSARRLTIEATYPL